MLQQARPEDFIISTGESHSLEEFVETAFDYLDLDWRDHVIVDRTLFRPTDIYVAQGNPTQAKQKLGWGARTKMKQVIGLMLQAEQKPPLEI